MDEASLCYYVFDDIHVKDVMIRHFVSQVESVDFEGLNLTNLPPFWNWEAEALWLTRVHSEA